MMEQEKDYFYEMVLLLVLCRTFSFVWIDSCNDVGKEWMSKKYVECQLFLMGEIKDLPQEDILMILRGADELISTGGRSMLAKI